MTTVSIELVPETVSFRACAIKGDGKTEKDELVRFLVIQGKPRYRGTYKHTLIELTTDGKKRNLPKLVSFTIRGKVDITHAEAEVAYLPKLTDAELGIADAEQISVDVNMGSEYFSDLWKLTQVNSRAKLSVGVSFRAPKTDITGHVVTWNADQIGGASSPIKAEQFWFNVDIPNHVSETSET